MSRLSAFAIAASLVASNVQAEKPQIFSIADLKPSSENSAPPLHRLDILNPVMEGYVPSVKAGANLRAATRTEGDIDGVPYKAKIRVDNLIGFGFELEF